VKTLSSSSIRPGAAGSEDGSAEAPTMAQQEKGFITLEKESFGFRVVSKPDFYPINNLPP
jgi:hypothetical protein